jgi:hypothetical protein
MLDQRNAHTNGRTAAAIQAARVIGPELKAAA